MATPVKEITPDTSSPSSPAGEQKLYSMDEQTILAKMEMLMNGKPFHYLDRDTLISEQERAKRKAIVEKLTSVVLGIRYKSAEGNTLFDYQDLHFDEPDHAWLQEKHPGVNVSGWGVIMILMDPLKYGKNLDRPLQQVLGTITRRSAKK
jgi:hypothetical protein